MPVRVLGDKEFRNLMRNVEEATFYSNKEREVLLGMSYGMFTSYQCKQLLKCFTFSDDKVKFLTLVYTNVVDKELFFVAVRQLSFSSDQDKVFDYIEHYHKKR